MWWLLFGGIALFAGVLHGVLLLDLRRRSHALRRELARAARRLEAVHPGAAEAGGGQKT